MATQQRTIDYLIEQARSSGQVSAKPMFGEYGLYVDGKMVGSVCDGQLFMQPTAAVESMPSRFLTRRHIQVPNHICQWRPIGGMMLKGSAICCDSLRPDCRY